MSRVACVLVAILLIAGPARAEAPPPDPSVGDTYDGRPHPKTWRDDLFLVPRLIFRPIELFFAAGIGLPFHYLLDWDESHHVHETVLEAFSSHDGKIGVRPTFQYSFGYRPIIGLRLFDQKLLGPNTDYGASLSTGGLDIIQADMYARPTRIDRAFAATFRVNYVRRDDQVFTAIGYADADPTLWTRPARYSIEAVDGVADLSLAARPGVFLGGTAMLAMRRFGNGVAVSNDPPIATVYCDKDLSQRCIPGTVDEYRVPGFDRGTQFVRLGANIRFDTRDNWWRPASGAVLDLGVDWSHGFAFDQSQYVRARGSLTGVLDLWQRSRTLLFKVSTAALEPIGSYAVPFSELIVLGGADDFRGFRPGLFRNYSSLLFSLEYRWPIWMWMDASVFSDYGGVFGRGFEGFGFGRMRPDVGGGVRLRSSSDFYVRAQIAYGWGDGLQGLLSFNTGL